MNGPKSGRELGIERKPISAIMCTICMGTPYLYFIISTDTGIGLGEKNRGLGDKKPSLGHYVIDET